MPWCCRRVPAGRDVEPGVQRRHHHQAHRDDHGDHVAGGMAHVPLEDAPDHFHCSFPSSRADSRQHFRSSLSRILSRMPNRMSGQTTMRNLIQPRTYGHASVCNACLAGTAGSRAGRAAELFPTHRFLAQIPSHIPFAQIPTHEEIRGRRWRMIEMIQIEQHGELHARDE